MERFARVHEETRRARRSQGRGYFLPNQPGFSHATDNHSSRARKDQFNRMLEFPANPISQGVHCRRLSGKRFFGDCRMINKVFTFQHSCCFNHAATPYIDSLPASNGFGIEL
jgi:hypothetical protein